MRPDLSGKTMAVIPIIKSCPDTVRFAYSAGPATADRGTFGVGAAP